VDREPGRPWPSAAFPHPVLLGGGTTHAGVRMQLTICFPALPIVLLLDLFPGDASSDSWQVVLFAQASF
jgi:hypothetical protein